MVNRVRNNARRYRARTLFRGLTHFQFQSAHTPEWILSNRLHPAKTAAAISKFES